MLRKWRDQFISEATQAGITWEDARYLLSKARTMQRLAEAQCNGDWPADNGERETAECPRCQMLWHPSAISKRTGRCVNCRAEDRTVALMGRYAPVVRVSFQGDPRGCVILLELPEGRSIGVPS